MMADGIRSIGEEISAKRTNYPHSIALVDGDRELTYQELDHRANRFAGYLARCGTLPGDTVAICMERSFDWIVAALGVIRAAAAYVPLDCLWPESRLQFAVRDSGATAVVARSNLLGRLRVNACGIDPCRDSAVIDATPQLAGMPIQPDRLAYVIYTSGSTGYPKGVEITHANLNHLIRWHVGTFGSRGVIAPVMWRVSDLTRPSGRFGQIFLRVQPSAWQRIPCARRRSSFGNG